MRNLVPFSTLVGETITKIVGGIGDDSLDFFTASGRHFSMYHYQDCCEHVELDDVVGGSLEDIIGEGILDAYETSQDDAGAYESATWTFYTIRTMFHTLTLRWYGESNGYYSEDVDFEEILPKDLDNPDWS